MDITASSLHQYIDRESGRVMTERLYGDRIVTLLYSRVNEYSPALFKLLTSPRMSALLAYFNYDFPLSRCMPLRRDFLRSLDIDLNECVDEPEWFDSARKIFERQIRYWQTRPMDQDPSAVVSPADARMLAGSLAKGEPLFLKGKFFDYEELLGRDRHPWLETFRHGEYAIFRLTPEKYHYNHLPVTGRVVDYYGIHGEHHACNPNAVIAMATPHSKNSRTVTVIDTDVPGGSRVGMVAMIEVVALMIGAIVQRYSYYRYQAPQFVYPGLFVEKGQPKSLYRPGSSTDVLLFESGRIRFCVDILNNMHHREAVSRFSAGFGRTLVETDVKVRSTIAYQVNREE